MRLFRLKAVRNERNMTQRELIRRMAERGERISVQTVSSWENGKWQPTGKHLAILSECLDCDIDDLYAYVPDPTEGAQ